MRTIKLFLLFCLPLNVFAQHGITFQVEELSKPEDYLFMLSSEEIYQGLILSDVNMYPRQAKNEGIDFPFNIVAKSQLPDNIVNFGYHSFFNGMYPYLFPPMKLHLTIRTVLGKKCFPNLPNKLLHKQVAK